MNDAAPIGLGERITDISWQSSIIHTSAIPSRRKDMLISTSPRRVNRERVRQI